MLLSQFRLIDLKQYQGRHQTPSSSGSSSLQNLDTSVVYEDFTIESTSLQPISGRTLQSIPEGYRTKAQYTFWTTTEIISLSQKNQTYPDQIFYKGEWYSIYSLDDWDQNAFLQHNQCVAILDTQNNSWQYDTDGGNYG